MSKTSSRSTCSPFMQTHLFVYLKSSDSSSSSDYNLLSLLKMQSFISKNIKILKEFSKRKFFSVGLSFWSTAPCSEMTLLRHEKAPISFQRKLSLEGSRPLSLLNYWGPRAVRTASFLLSVLC
ncbi:hypothetical protein ALC57_07686 [Trachymyrmex cornetzi]|uniref:Uncharacterized protein n=1 Tax=Trachymyrmex cornetzi TaxID=471704 RepID=A0A195E4T6_9HYME|nr:hypothetical protein ALC57_07686 [Trachymyrmex cornetzi]